LSTAAARKTTPPAPTNLPDDDAVIAVNLSKIRSAQDTAASNMGSLRNVLKHAEGKGVHLKAAKRAIAIVKAGDADSWLEETSAITRYLRIMRHGITDSQMALEFESTLAPLEEKAQLDGRAAGLDGAREDMNPHALNTRAGQAWLTAFRQGLSERELVLSMKDDVDTGDDDAAADDDGDED
jgi:ribosome modulation factor